MKNFKDFPDFTPDLTPREIFLNGSFGGTYWRPIYSDITKKWYKDQHKEFNDWWVDIPEYTYLTTPWIDYNKNINKYKVKVGSTLEFWEKKNWIHPQDPYGWVQWYCRFYNGRRTQDDIRQIKRWKGIKNRFLKQLQNKDSLAIKQTLQHWAIKS